MTLVMNRADRVYRRRIGALARIDNGERDLSTPEQRRATEEEALTLLARTKAAPTIRHTRKKLSDPNCSAARKFRRSGKLS